MHEFFFGGFEVHRDHESLNEFSDFRADHVRAEQFTRLLVEDGLYQPLVFSKRNRLAVGTELETSDANVIAGFLGPFFRQSDAGHLRIAIGATRDHVLVQRMNAGNAGNLFNTDNALVLGLVCQHRRAGDIADGVDAFDIGFAVAVDDDAAPVGLHTEFFKSEIFDVSLNTDGGNQPVGGDRLGFAVLGFHMRRDACWRPFRPLRPWLR